MIGHPLRRSTLIISVFRRSTCSFSFLPHLRPSILQPFQTKVLLLSNFSQKLLFSVSSSRNDATLATAEVTITEGEKPEHSIKTLMDRELHVGNLLRGRGGITEDNLFRYFSQYGEIEVLEFFRDKFTNLPRGFAFVTFCDVESAKRVLAKSHIIDGKNVTIEVPVKKQQSAVHSKKDSTVLVNNIMNYTSKEVIEEHFSQFGKVDKVILAQKGESDGDVSSYYVLFSSLSGAKKALEKPTQRIADQGIEFEVMVLPIAAKYRQRTNRLGITSIPDSLTVEDLRDYFQQFGDVEFVDFIVHGRKVAYSQKPQDSHNAAVVRFSDEATVEEIIKSKNHVINGSEVEVSKYKNIRALAPELMRELKVSVEGLPLSTKQKELNEYFEQTFSVMPNGVFLKEPHVFDKKLVCIVRFSNKMDLERVLKEANATFNGFPLYFRRVVWKK